MSRKHHRATYTPPPLPAAETAEEWTPCPARHSQDPDRPRRPADGMRLCKGHRAFLEQAIAETPALHRELVLSLTRSEVPVGEKVRSTPNPGLSLNERVIECRDEVADWLSRRALAVMLQRGLTGPPSADLDTVAVWLLPHVDWLAAQPWAGHIVDTGREVRGKARALRQASDVRRYPVGPCTLTTTCDLTTGQEQLCPGEIEASLRGGEVDVAADLTCTVCGDTSTSGEWLRKYVRKAS